jgi:2-polyprenyl-3-methyl-5-hydroxy-6-metoxy-1,4-benzoquinol methylase
MGAEFQYVACNLCGADDAAVLSSQARWGQSMTNVVCRRCGLVYANPRLGRERLDRFYREWVYPEFIANGRFSEHLIASSRRQASETFHYFAGRASQPFAGTRLLEVGPGLGDFLVLAREAGADILGAEMDGLYADFAERERRLPIIRTHIEALDEHRTFDLIALFHVLEHLEDPARTLAMLRTRLAPGGRLLIEVPDVMAPWGSSPAEFFRIEHLYNFSLQTLGGLLAKAGLRIVARDDERFLLRVVAAAADERVDAPDLSHHYDAVRRHFLKWRARARLLAPYYALRRLMSRSARQR